MLDILSVSDGAVLPVWTGREPVESQGSVKSVSDPGRNCLRQTTRQTSPISFLTVRARTETDHRENRCSSLAIISHQSDLERGIVRF